MSGQNLQTSVTGEYDKFSYKNMLAEYLKEISKKMANCSDFDNIEVPDQAMPQSTSSWDYCEPARKIFINLAPSYADTLNMEDLGSENLVNNISVDTLGQQIAKRFAELNQVKAVYLYEGPDGIEVNTIMKSRHYQSRRCLYSKQLQIHDLYPEIDIDFNIIFSKDEIPESDLPGEAIICFSR